jgi:hypothetical protein
MKRWTCPKCSSGALAPRAPRRDDVRRYCLACSKKTGHLVERKCLAAEKAVAVTREKMAALRSERTRRVREKASTRWTAGGHDVRALARRCWTALVDVAFPKTTFLGDAASLLDIPEIVLRRSKLHPRQASGRGGRRRITLRIGFEATRAAVEMLVLHELAHSANARNGGRRDGPHGPSFNRILSGASVKLFELGLPIQSGYGPSRFLERTLAKRYGEATIYPRLRRGDNRIDVTLEDAKRRMGIVPDDATGAPQQLMPATEGVE